MQLQNLTSAIFLALRDAFFQDDGTPKPFALRAKQSTQDDPFDEYVSGLLANSLSGASCYRASGPLISPDLVVLRPKACQQVSREALRTDLTRIVAVEVKKLERSSSGQVARSTGMDYNTTPPCGTVRVYDSAGTAVDIPGFYLFVCQEPASDGMVQLTALTLCDGDALNADFAFYLSITGRRTKSIGLGTYGDGLNRNRPMLIFSNPLGALQLDHAVSLVSRARIESDSDAVSMMYQIGRTIPEGGQGMFYVYRRTTDVPVGWEPEYLVDPFPKPVRRLTDTQGRGKFKLPLQLAVPAEEDNDLT